ncbi:hypothetical protein ACQPXB_29205 [Amycolatopsis sp. CA-161197]|uniref:hypothetical protein n=1 Tax=unclassified Amycolatopsis TaxID=2618356 RepID=UPI00345345C7
MPQREYSTADIKLIEFDESVRHWPGMYFGVTLDDPKLPTDVLIGVIGHAVHPATHLADPRSPVVRVEILGDLTFSITDDQLCPAERCRVPERGYFESLLGPDRWTLAAAAVVSRRTVVEVWRAGSGLSQELSGLRPVGSPESFTASHGRGTTVTIELDPDCLGANAAITTDIDTLALYHQDDCGTAAPHQVTINDRRGGR